jgi:hypothetical protein
MYPCIQCVQCVHVDTLDTFGGVMCVIPYLLLHCYNVTLFAIPHQQGVCGVFSVTFVTL